MTQCNEILLNVTLGMVRSGIVTKCYCVTVYLTDTQRNIVNFYPKSLDMTSLIFSNKVTIELDRKLDKILQIFTI